MDKRKIFVLLSVGAISLLIIKRLLQKKIINAINSFPRYGKWAKRQLSEVTDITIHHGASSRTATIEDYNRWHTQEKGWPSIGYHYVIDQKGNIFQTNYIDSLTYHNGFNNTYAIGVAMIGNFDEYPIPKAQKESLVYLIKFLKKKKALPKLKRLIGHKEYAGKTACPGRYTDMDELRKAVKMKGKSGAKIYALTGRDVYYNFEEADN
jgi:N-acetyl-anhydromuramyl-L-alanine amidase AmpD